MPFNRLLLIIGSFLILLALPACGGEPAGSETSAGAPAAVESYLQALVAKDADALVNAACADWEADARVELDSFGAVTPSLEGLSSQESGQQEGLTLVSCTGKLIANYGNEVLEINLADRLFQAAFEGGEWRMCGYR